MLARLACKTAFSLCAFLAVSIQAGSVRAQPVPSEREDAQRIGDLVIANHILADQNILDAWGHVSIRSAGNPKHFYLSRSVAPALVKPEDIMEYDGPTKVFLQYLQRLTSLDHGLRYAWGTRAFA